MLLKTVYLTYVNEANIFCERFLQLYDTYPCKAEKDEDWGNKVVLHNVSLSKTMMNDLSIVLVSVFNSFRLLQMVEGIVQQSYYYRECTEIQRILELSQDMLLEQDKNGWSTYKNKRLHNILHKIFTDQLYQSDTLHFDSVVKFCLEPLKKELIAEVGLVIDDFKREEEHQAFIQTVREHVAKRDFNCDVIYLLQGRNFSYYTENGERLQKEHLQPYMGQTPLYLFGLGLEEWNLAPLIALSPKHIIIYSDQLSESKTLAIINVFQERVIVRPLEEFPFET